MKSLCMDQEKTMPLICGSVSLLGFICGLGHDPQQHVNVNVDDGFHSAGRNGRHDRKENTSISSALTTSWQDVH